METPYTDTEGVVHIRNAGTGTTLCGKDAAWYSEARPLKCCDECPRISTENYARRNPSVGRHDGGSKTH